MNIHEHQAKTVLAEFGAPVPRGFAAFTVDEAVMIAGLTRGSDAALISAIPLTLLACAGIGLVNGIGIGIAKLPPFITTLSSGITFFGVALGLTAGSSQQPVAAALQKFMNSSWLGLPYPILLTALFVAAAWLFQNRSAEGRKLYAIGSSPGRLQPTRSVVYAPASLAFCWPAIRRAPPSIWEARC